MFPYLKFVLAASILLFLIAPKASHTATGLASAATTPATALAPAPTEPMAAKSLDVHVSATRTVTTVATVPRVPFYSQFTDITAPFWKKVGCGITDLTMIIDYYHPGVATVNEMLRKGLAAGAYDYNAGWIYQGLINLSHAYSLDGRYYDLSGLSQKAALARFESYLGTGPVILSVHYKFNPASTIPHLIVVNGISNNVVYYNDPATTVGTQAISLSRFLQGWKRKVIVIRPTSTAAASKT